jgi:hypothetical protein
MRFELGGLAVYLVLFAYVNVLSMQFNINVVVSRKEFLSASAVQLSGPERKR